jgi:hypothetical protein
LKKIKGKGGKEVRVARERKNRVKKKLKPK